MSVRENLAEVRGRIEKVARSMGRDPGRIKLIAVIKNVPLGLVIEALEAGVTEIGENRVQEAQARCAEIKRGFPQVALHMIGHLQKNKVRQALDTFDIIHSVDSVKLALEIDRRAREKNAIFTVLLEVNVSGEASKCGIPIDSVLSVVKEISVLENIKVTGLMTVPPLVEDAEETRKEFIKLRELSQKIEDLKLPRLEMRFLSMGMSNDFEVAIQEGSNMVRIGRAIFGPRP